jgi:short-subunit dehydrogenase
MAKTIIITGGSDGLGKQMAKTLSAGNNVIILSPTEEKLKKAAAEIGCDYKVADVRNYEQIEEVFEEIISEHGQVDVLINNAALWIQEELDENDPELIGDVIDVNLTGVIYSTKAIIPHFKKQKAGIIININSQAGLYTKAERAVYHASKWGMTGFTRSMQDELGKYGIKVVGIYPGKMRTEMFSKVNIEKSMDDALDTSKVADLVDKVIHLDGDVHIPELGVKSINY